MGDRFEFRAVGVLRSPFVAQEGTPIQPVFAAGAEGVIEVEPRFVPALADLGGFDRIWVLYVFHQAAGYEPCVVPYLDDRPHGVFATRAPTRPNPIGLSTLRLLGIEGSSVHVADVDILDGTPVLDIKPYVPRFDAFTGLKSGWLDENRTRRRRADPRFAGDEESAQRSRRPRPGSAGDMGGAS